MSVLAHARQKFITRVPRLKIGTYVCFSFFSSSTRVVLLYFIAYDFFIYRNYCYHAICVPLFSEIFM